MWVLKWTIRYFISKYGQSGYYQVLQLTIVNTQKAQTCKYITYHPRMQVKCNLWETELVLKKQQEVGGFENNKCLFL